MALPADLLEVIAWPLKQTLLWTEKGELISFQRIGEKKAAE